MAATLPANLPDFSPQTEVMKWLELKEPSALQAQACSEWMTEAARARKARWDYFAEPIAKAFSLHKDLTSKRNEAIRPVDAFIDSCKRIISRHGMVEQAKREKLRREEEARALAEAKARQEAEAQHAFDLAAETGDEAAMTDAVKLADEPVIAPVVSLPEPEKIAGASVRMVKVAFIATTAAKKTILRYLLEGQRDDLIESWIDFNQAQINRSINKGLVIPGLTLREEAETRRTGRIG